MLNRHNSDSIPFLKRISNNIVISQAMKTIPSHVKTLFLLMGVTLLGLTITKIIFYTPNHHAFPEISITDLIAALWFDIVTVSLVFIPFFSLWLIPFKNRTHLFYKSFFRILFLLLNGMTVGINLMDVIYFQYTSKRATFDLFSMVGYEEDMGKLWLTFIKDFWWVILIFIIMLWFADKAFRIIYSYTFKKADVFSLKKQVLAFAILVPLFIFLGRGGAGLRPISVINAAQYTRPENTAFVINTAFTMIKSYNETPLDHVEFMPEEIATKLFSPFRKVGHQTQYKLNDNTNVMIIILESFGNEWVGPDEKGKSFTPFFDSLCNEGHLFKNSIANGKKSIEALPAILASIPGLIDNAYISSMYSSNKLTGIGNVMKKHGYNTSLYHGATNGSMNFDGFSALTGFDKYYGRTEYNNEDHNDGTWGIFDHYFLPWTARELSKNKQPFLSVLFTLSSHHPYKVPKEFENKLPSGPHPICRSIAYTDMSLNLFFEEAKKEDWFKNTLFVFVADHTPASKSSYYGQRIGMYQIPILFYTPSGIIDAHVSEDLFQQVDIFPTILDLLNKKETIYSFGQSAFSREYEPFAITYMEGTYQLFKDNFLFTYTNEKTKQLYDFKVDLSMTNDLYSEKKDKIKGNEKFLKAIIQRYNNDLILNKTHIP